MFEADEEVVNLLVCVLLAGSSADSHDAHSSTWVLVITDLVKGLSDHLESI